MTVSTIVDHFWDPNISKQLCEDGHHDTCDRPWDRPVRFRLWQAILSPRLGGNLPSHLTILLQSCRTQFHYRASAAGACSTGSPCGKSSIKQGTAVDKKYFSPIGNKRKWSYEVYPIFIYTNFGRKTKQKVYETMPNAPSYFCQSNPIKEQSK